MLTLDVVSKATSSLLVYLRVHLEHYRGVCLSSLLLTFVPNLQRNLGCGSTEASEEEAARVGTLFWSKESLTERKIASFVSHRVAVRSSLWSSRLGQGFATR